VKRLSIGAFLLGSSLVHAHSHEPYEFKKYLTESQFKLTVDVQNHFKNPTCYDIEVNGSVFLPYRTCLEPSEKRSIAIWLQSPADVVTKQTVCSIAVSTGSISTRMCTKVSTLYAKKYLSHD